MTVAEIIGLVLVLLVMGVGILGAVLPVLPGPPLVMIAAVVHRLCFGELSAGWWALFVMALLLIIALGLDYLGSVYGAKRMGAGWRGMTGAVLGAMVGLFMGLPGILLGPFIGAMAFEWIGGKEWPLAAKAGAGAVLGMLVGAVGKVACAVAMAALFTINLLWTRLAAQ